MHAAAGSGLASDARPDQRAPAHPHRRAAQGFEPGPSGRIAPGSRRPAAAGRAGPLAHGRDGGVAEHQRGLAGNSGGDDQPGGAHHFFARSFRCPVAPLARTFTTTARSEGKAIATLDISVSNNLPVRWVAAGAVPPLLHQYVKPNKHEKEKCLIPPPSLSDWKSAPQKFARWWGKSTPATPSTSSASARPARAACATSAKWVDDEITDHARRNGNVVPQADPHRQPISSSATTASTRLLAHLKLVIIITMIQDSSNAIT